MGAKEEYEARKRRQQTKRDAKEKAALENAATAARIAAEREEREARIFAERAASDSAIAAAESDAKRWWFRQRNPIDRFTGWLVVWTAALFIATIANAVILHHTDEKIGEQAKIAGEQRKVMQEQLNEMRSTGKQTDELIAATKQSADAAKLSATAAHEGNATVRAQLKASVIVPDEPDSIIRVGENGGISVDLYLVNTGQSWARDVYANIEVIIIKNGQQRIYFAPPVWFGGIDISQTTPWHHTFTDFQPLFTGQIKNDDLLTVEIIIGISYFDIFDEKTLRYFRVKGWGDGDVNSRCCTLKEFQGGLGFQRQADMSRVPPLPPR